MAKQQWRAGNMLYPLPAVLVSCGDREGRFNMMTAAWTGTICSDPAQVYVSIRKSRYSHEIISDTGEYVINLTTRDLAFAADFAGVRSGRDMDKFSHLHLTPKMGSLTYAPMIEESPVCIECRVSRVLELGSHDMFIGEIASVYADEAYMDENGRFDLARAKPLVYVHGQYYDLGKPLGKFGFSVKKKRRP